MIRHASSYSFSTTRQVSHQRQADQLIEHVTKSSHKTKILAAEYTATFRKFSGPQRHRDDYKVTNSLSIFACKGDASCDANKYAKNNDR
jgi:hypothetical protein